MGEYAACFVFAVTVRTVPRFTARGVEDAAPYKA
jgi:hypothetical protein